MSGGRPAGESMPWFQAKVVAETQMAILFEHVDSDEPQWVPRSTIKDMTLSYEIGETVDVEIAGWKARDLGWE